MEVDTLSNHPGESQLPAMTYWRRRFLALTVGLGILSLIVWAFAGALGAGGSGPSAAGARAPRGHEGKAAARAGGRGPGGTSSGASAGPSPSAGPSAAAQRPTSASGGHAPQAGQGQYTRARASVRASGLVRACRPGDVVLSLFSSQDSYGRGQPPEFDVDVVSTAAGTCAFDVGPGHLSLVVRASGKRVWGSARCDAGGGTLATDLARGVPAIAEVSWDLETSAHGCRASASRRASPGSYTASASDGGIASNSVTFKVGR